MKRHEIREQALSKLGGHGSGHYGHAGRRGHQGGSLPGKTAMSLKTGKTAGARQAAASGDWSSKGDVQTRVGGGMRATVTPDGDNSMLTVVRGETKAEYKDLTEEEALQKGNGEFLRNDVSKVLPDTPAGRDLARIVDVDEPNIEAYRAAADVAKAILSPKSASPVARKKVTAADRTAVKQSKQLSVIINLLTKKGNMPWWLKTVTIIGVIASKD